MAHVMWTFPVAVMMWFWKNEKLTVNFLTLLIKVVFWDVIL
jgi:hypothetical protein